MLPAMLFLLALAFFASLFIAPLYGWDDKGLRFLGFLMTMCAGSALVLSLT